MEFKYSDHFIYLYDGINEVGHIEYIPLDNQIIDVIHTIVKENYQGQGIAGKLFNELLSFVKKNDLKIIPTCSYIAHQIEKNPELNSLTHKA